MAGGEQALETLYISGGDRRDLSPETLARLPHLAHVSIGNGNLDDAWAEPSPSLASLQALDLSGNPLSIGVQRKLLERLPQLDLGLSLGCERNACRDRGVANRVSAREGSVRAAGSRVGAIAAGERRASPDEESTTPMEDRSPTD